MKVVLRVSLLVSFCVSACWALAIKEDARKTVKIGSRTSNGLQDVVTWDQHSLFVHGERLMIYSGEIHPFRLPVPSLWLDLFQKVKALGFNTVSFYTDWALHEGNPGHFTAEDVFAYEPFFEAAMEAGLYLIARPGPHINGEASGGGYPGWLARIKGPLRTRSPDYTNATANYVKNIGEIFAKAQITNGGPIILVQPENEYSGYTIGEYEWPDVNYMQALEDALRATGIVVPFISNDAVTNTVGPFAPGTGIGQTDLYSHDAYPMGFACGAPYTWPLNKLPTMLTTVHHKLQAVSYPWCPNALLEFQGGAYDPWGGWGNDNCAILMNEQAERLQYKNTYASVVTILNIYMLYGGTNWGNLGHPGGYTSYDYGAAIDENRIITREKYSELKLQAHFLKASTDYLTATPGLLTNETYVSTTALTVTPAFGNQSFSNTSFWVVRHSDYTSTALTTYTITVNTTAGNIRIPQLGGALTLNGRDSKIHVTDYNLGGINLLYSSAEIFTWQAYHDKKVIVLYGDIGETHELALVADSLDYQVHEGSGVTTREANGTIILQWQTAKTRHIIQVGKVFFYLLDRNSAYDFWVPEISGTNSSVIIKAGYLVRTASAQGNKLQITADFNATTSVEVIGAPAEVQEITINGNLHNFVKSAIGSWSTSVTYSEPKLDLPSAKELKWKFIDSLPELQISFDDSQWIDADFTTSNNPLELATPTSLYSSDYGFHYGTLIYRGHFQASGFEGKFFLETQGGAAFGSSVFLNDTFIGSWSGNDRTSGYNSSYTLPELTKGSSYVLTVVIDTLGLEQNYWAGLDKMKTPRGILRYALTGSNSSTTPIKWKLTGNLGGEQYHDLARGPLNEGGMFAERQGYHQPSPPSQTWKDKSPADGISKAGIGWFTADFDLALPEGYDIPLVFHIRNNTINGTVPSFRTQIYVNGYQFGKYVSNVGPQRSFPVPEGILNYRGANSVAVSLWALDAGGASLDIELETDQHVGVPIQTSMKEVKSVPQPAWKLRENSY